jgi:hypothetical protein
VFPKSETPNMMKLQFWPFTFSFYPFCALLLVPAKFFSEILNLLKFAFFPPDFQFNFCAMTMANDPFYYLQHSVLENLMFFCPSSKFFHVKWAYLCIYKS